MNTQQIRFSNTEKYTSRVMDALIAAGNHRINEEYQGEKKVYWMDGYKFIGPRQLGQHILKQYNEWMIGCGLVDLDIIKDARYSNSGANYFIVS